MEKYDDLESKYADSMRPYPWQKEMFCNQIREPIQWCLHWLLLHDPREIYYSDALWDERSVVLNHLKELIQSEGEQRIYGENLQKELKVTKESVQEIQVQLKNWTSMKNSFGREKKMIEQMMFWCGGYFGTNKLFTIKNHNAYLTLDYYVFSHEYPREVFPHFHDEWTRERSKRWLPRIAEIHFELWKDKYWANILDGEQWKLRYQYEGENEREIFGSNAYPENWNQFSKLMTTIAKKLPRAENINVRDLLGLL